MRIPISKTTWIRVYRALMAAMFLAILFSSSWICHGFYLGYSGGGVAKETRIVVPTGYEGPVLIIWSVPGGQTAEIKDEGRLLYYYLQNDDGALLIEDEPDGPHPFGIPLFYLQGTLTFWRNLPGPHKQFILNRCPDASWGPKVGLCAGGIGGSTIINNGIVSRERPFVSYILTTYEDKSAAWDELFELKTEYEDRIIYFPGESTP